MSSQTGLLIAKAESLNDFGVVIQENQDTNILSLDADSSIFGACFCVPMGEFICRVHSLRTNLTLFFRE